MKMTRFALLLALIAVGCGSITAPTEEMLTEKEQWAKWDAECYTKDQGRGPAKVYFKEEALRVPCEGGPGSPAFCDAAAWAYPTTNKIVFWKHWVNNAPKEYINEVAAHEATHVREFHMAHDAVFRALMASLLLEKKEECGL